MQTSAGTSDRVDARLVVLPDFASRCNLAIAFDLASAMPKLEDGKGSWLDSWIRPSCPRPCMSRQCSLLDVLLHNAQGETYAEDAEIGKDMDEAKWDNAQ